MNNNLDDQNFEKVLMILACVGLFCLLVMIKPPVVIDNSTTQPLAVEHVIELKQNSTRSNNTLESSNWGWWPWSQIQCLAANIYYESRGEPHEGQVAVGIITLNRVKDARWASTICEVVKQQTLVKYHDNNQYKSKLVCQFSWYCDGSMYSKINQKEWNKSIELAFELIYSNKYNHLNKIYQNAYYFHSTSVNPAWASRVKLIKQTGNHLFYKDI